MTIYRYGRDGLVSYNLTDDELMLAHIEYQLHEDEMTVIGTLDAAGYDELCDLVYSDTYYLREAARQYRNYIEFGFDGEKELQYVLEACEFAAEKRRSA